MCPQTNTNKLTHKAPLRESGQVHRVKEYSPVFSTLAWCSQTHFNRAEQYTGDKNICRKRHQCYNFFWLLCGYTMSFQKKKKKTLKLFVFTWHFFSFRWCDVSAVVMAFDSLPRVKSFFSPVFALVHILVGLADTLAATLQDTVF